MKKTMIFFLLMQISTTGIYAQVTIGDDTPPAATLDVVANDGSTPAGVIAPRLTLTELAADDSKYLAAQTGAIVYVKDVTGTTTTKTANITAVGYYYFDGTVWQAMVPASTEPWRQAGTTNQATANTQDIYQMGQIGIGTTTPSTKLDINAGNAPGTGFKMTDGTQGVNKVLTSDANGVGMWVDPMDILYIQEPNLIFPSADYKIVDQAAQRYGKIIQFRVILEVVNPVTFDASGVPTTTTARWIGTLRIAPYRYMLLQGMQVVADPTNGTFPASGTFYSAVITNFLFYLQGATDNTTLPAGTRLLFTGTYMYGADNTNYPPTTAP